MKTFELSWRDGKVERVRGKSISDAFNSAGYSSGALPALDTWKELKELPSEEKYLYIVLKGEVSEILNPAYIKEIRKHGTLNVADTVSFMYANIEHILTVTEITRDSIILTKANASVSY